MSAPHHSGIPCCERRGTGQEELKGGRPQLSSQFQRLTGYHGREDVAEWLDLYWQELEGAAYYCMRLSRSQKADQKKGQDMSHKPHSLVAYVINRVPKAP